MRLARIVLALGAALALAACAQPGPPGPPPARGAGSGAGQAVPPLVVSATVAGALRPLPRAALPTTLTAVAFASPATGTAVGYRCGGPPAHCDGVLLGTADGGQTWQSAGTVPAALSAVRLLPDGFGWASGPAVLALHTSGGRDWTTSALPPHPGEPLVFADFVDAENGWTAFGDRNCATQGCPLAIWRTADGGRTWTAVASNAPPGSDTPKGALGWLTFADGGLLGPGSGWLLSTTPAPGVWITGDGGQTWRSTITFDIGGEGSAAAFAPGGNGWAAGRTGDDRSRLAATTDGGAHWTAVGSAGGTVAGLSASADGTTAWALVGQGCTAAQAACALVVLILTPTGAGPPLPGPTGAVLSGLDAETGSSAWAVGTGHGGSSLLQTTDGGHHWSVRYTTGQPQPAGPWGFWNSTTGWALGDATDAGAVLSSTDGGASWSAVGQVPGTTVVGGGFPSARFGWAITDQGQLWLSRDGGSRWSLAPASRCFPARAAGFAGPDLGWVLTGGRPCDWPLDVTTDGGQSWRQVAPLPPGAISSITYAASGAGWAVVGPTGGAGDALLERAAATGRPWRPVVDLGPAQDWVGTTLRTDASGGLWLGNLRSTDGGQHFTRYALDGVTPDAGAPPVFDFISPQVGWVAAGGGLYQSHDDGRNWVQVAALAVAVADLPAAP